MNCPRGGAHGFVGEPAPDKVLVMTSFVNVGRRGRGTRLGGRALRRAFQRFGKPPFGLRLKFEAEAKGGRRLEVVLSHEDGYEATAISVVFCVLQWLDSSARRPWYRMMGHLVEPVLLIADTERIEMQVVLKQT